MTIATASLVSEIPDTRDRPLDEGPGDDDEYAALMRRTGIAEGEAGTRVSAFNSSI